MLGLLAALALILMGCSKGEEFDPKKPFALPGADKVLESLQKKDYEATVAGLAQVRASVQPKDQAEYRRLRERVLDQLVSEMGDSEPAKDAYRAIGLMETGR
ncbi:MAG TPA: hypothetical protein DCE44_14425 [Verrucomicrobiales bacterium]|nr:hypothetical protein [Verrucomicrobiales bacterium]